MNEDNEKERIEGAGLEHRVLIIPGGPAAQGEPAVDKAESTYLDQDGLHELTVLRIKYAPGCNHMLHTAKNTGAICSSCGLLLCSECSNEVCYSCQRPVCGLCRNTEIVGDEERVYCSPCLRDKKRRARRDALLVTGITWSAVFAVLWLLWKLACSTVFSLLDICS